MSKEILRPVFAAMGFLASLALVGCGGSGQTRPGTGGTTGAGGTSNSTGGSSGTGTGGASSGTGGAMPLACTTNPTNPLLSNFMPADANDGGVTPSGGWGTFGMLTGHTFGYSGTMTNDAGVKSMVNATIDTTKFDLELHGTVNAADYAGGGMSFDQCVNTSTWTGVQFTLGGTADGCNITFMLQTESQEPPSNKGTCTASSCYDFPQVKVTIPATAGTPTVVKFATDLANTGMPPAAADFEKEMFGLQWQFTSAAPPDGGMQVGCSPDMTISNVMWTTN